MNFNDEKSRPLTDYYQRALHLTMNNDYGVSMTRHAMTIDAVFSRFLDKLESRVFTYYYSYHKPIVSFLKVSHQDTHTKRLTTVSYNNNFFSSSAHLLPFNVNTFHILENFMRLKTHNSKN